MPTGLEFVTLLAIIVVIPPIFEARFRVPGLVGLIVVGYLTGPEAMEFFEASDEEFIELFAHIGLIFLMFLAGLEVELDQFVRVKYSSLLFGLLSFAFPCAAGVSIGLAFGLPTAGAILMGSLLGSHTLLALSIARKFGIVNQRCITVGVGGTIVTDVVSLLVLAFAVRMGALGPDESLGLGSVILLAAKEIGYLAVAFVTVNVVLRSYFGRAESSREGGFLAMFLLLMLAADLGELIDVEPILGAFAAGLAMNHAIQHRLAQQNAEKVRPIIEGAKSHLVFIGTVLFIPSFFVDLGIELEFSAVLADTSGASIAGFLLVGLLAGKFIAAVISQWILGYSSREMLSMWSLSIPQVGATLAAAFLGLEVGLISESVLAGVIALVVATTVAGPLLFRRFASRLPIQSSN